MLRVLTTFDSSLLSAKWSLEKNNSYMVRGEGALMKEHWLKCANISLRVWAPADLLSLFKHFVSDVLQSWIRMVVVEYVWKFLT